MSSNFENDKTILIVDDDATTRYMSRITVEEAGYTVVEADSGENALEIFNKNIPDAILLDVNLPGIDGYSTCETIKGTKVGKKVPVIMVTGLDDTESIDKAYQVGATDFIIKPISWPILSRRLRHIIRAKQSEDEIHYLAYYDSLTGLPNRLLFNEHLQYAIDQAERNSSSVAVLMLDVDNFKLINDSLGHLAGDTLLCKITERLNNYLRTSDKIARSCPSKLTSLARFGGDEFTIMLQQNVTPKEMAIVSKRIISAMSQTILIDEHELSLSVSVGMAMFPTDGNNSEVLLKNAESAMYHAKEQGKNTFCFYDRTMNQFALEKLKFEHDLTFALERNEFYLEFQPKVCLQTNQAIGFEALIRWKHKELGVINPTQFINIAEESNLIHDIGVWSLYEACSACKAWREKGYQQTISVNLSARQFNNKYLANVVEQALMDTELPPECLELELTESMIMDKSAATLNVLAKLKEIGVKLSIDDFGTGYSSLQYLSQFPIDVLKIDKSFIDEVASNSQSSLIAQAIIALAHGLNLKVVAEGVETQEQLDFLRSKNCDYVQGFYFCRPLPIDKMLSYLMKK